MWYVMLVPHALSYDWSQMHPNNQRCCRVVDPQGALNFGLRAMCHQKDPIFFRSLSPKDPHFYQLSPNDPLFFENFDIFDKMLRNFWPFWP